MGFRGRRAATWCGFVALAALACLPTAVHAGRVLSAVTGLNPGDLVVADFSNERLIRVDPLTGTQTLVASGGTGAGSLDGGPSGLAILNGPLGQPTTGRIFVANQATSSGNTNPYAIVQFDWDGVTATSSNLTSGNFLQPGSVTLGPRDVAFDNNGNLISINRGFGSGNRNLVRINPATGAQSLLATINTMSDPAAVAVDPGTGNIYVGGIDGVITRVDGVTFAQTVVGSGSVGSGTALGQIAGLAFDANGNLIIGQLGQQNIVRLDLNTLNRTLVGSMGFPVSDLTIGEDGTIWAIRSTSANGGLFSVDPITGVPTLVSQGDLFDDAGTVLNGIALFAPLPAIPPPLAPEPGTWLLFAITLGSLGGWTWWRRRRLG